VTPPGQLRRILSRTGRHRGSRNFTGKDGLKGGHVIMLGAGNGRGGAVGAQRFSGRDCTSVAAINAENARGWLEAGASHVIVTSWVFATGTWMNAIAGNCRKPLAESAGASI